MIPTPQQHQVLQLLARLGTAKLSEIRASKANPYKGSEEALIDTLNRLRIKGLITKQERGYYETTEVGKEIASPNTKTSEQYSPDSSSEHMSTMTKYTNSTRAVG